METMDEFRSIARRLVYEHSKALLELSGSDAEFTPTHVFIVESGQYRTVWRALLITSLPNSIIYEVNYNKIREDITIEPTLRLETKYVSVDSVIHQ